VGVCEKTRVGLKCEAQVPAWRHRPTPISNLTPYQKSLKSIYIRIYTCLKTKEKGRIMGVYEIIYPLEVRMVSDRSYEVDCVLFWSDVLLLLSGDGE